MKRKLIWINNTYFSTDSFRVYLGIILCRFGIHNKRIRKNGKKLEYVCKRTHCNYCERVR